MFGPPATALPVGSTAAHHGYTSRRQAGSRHKLDASLNECCSWRVAEVNRKHGYYSAEAKHGDEPGVVAGDEGAQGREVITGQQIRAARELLGWTPYRLAPRAGIGHTLLRRLEAGARVPDEASAGRLRAALEEAGVIFTADGVKLSRNLRGGRVPEQLNADKDGERL